ncbi:hypothetical protein BG011_001300, partial [Mortierella polycephala]
MTSVRTTCPTTGATAIFERDPTLGMKFQCICGLVFLSRDAVREHYKKKCSSIGAMVTLDHFRTCDSRMVAADEDGDSVADSDSISENEDVNSTSIDVVRHPLLSQRQVVAAFDDGSAFAGKVSSTLDAQSLKNDLVDQRLAGLGKHQEQQSHNLERQMDLMNQELLSRLSRVEQELRELRKLRDQHEQPRALEVDKSSTRG